MQCFIWVFEHQKCFVTVCFKTNKNLTHVIWVQYQSINSTSIQPEQEQDLEFPPTQKESAIKTQDINTCNDRRKGDPQVQTYTPS